MTVSFTKVTFTAQEVLDLVSDCQGYHLDSAGTELDEFERKFIEQAEERSRAPENQLNWVKLDGTKVEPVSFSGWLTEAFEQASKALAELPASARPVWCPPIDESETTNG